MHTRIVHATRRVAKFPKVDGSISARFADHVPMVDEDFDDMFDGADLSGPGVSTRFGCGVRWLGFGED
jgi:hypothetical protein